MEFLEGLFTETAGEGGFLDNLITVAPMLIIFVLFYFVLIRPQTKKEKEDQKMRDSLEIADEVVTSGGIIGRVVSIKDDTLVIETGSDRCKIRVAKWAIAQNLTAKEAAEEAKAAKDEKKEEKKDEK